MRKINMYIAAHKKYKFPDAKNYIPIQVGAALHPELGYLKDSAGDNISEKNPNYCELTALYYLWKNEKNIDIIGLSHYRRYFFKNNFYSFCNKVLNCQQINKIMKYYDIILPESFVFEEKTIKENYANHHNVKDLELCGDIIKKKFPDYYDSFNNVLNRKTLYAYNMFVMRKNDFDNYMKWLFEILFDLEGQIDISKYDDYNKRIYGFLSERLFNVWIEKNNLSIKTLPVYNIERSLIRQTLGRIKRQLKSFIGVGD